VGPHKGPPHERAKSAEAGRALAGNNESLVMMKVTRRKKIKLLGLTQQVAAAG